MFNWQMSFFWQVCLVIFVPIVLAGLVRVFLDKYRILAFPLDFGFKHNNKRLFGENKTWGGLIILAFFSWLFGFCLSYFTNLNTFLPNYYGLYLGIFYTLGELINSSIKRQMEVGPGQNLSGFLATVQYLIDQVDSILSISIFLLIFQVPFVLQFAILGILIHFLIDILNHLIGSKKHSDKYGMIAFYQILFYLLLFPLKLFIWQKPQVSFKPKEPKILTSNHPFFLDSLILLCSLQPKEFLQLVPLRYIVVEKFNRHLFTVLIKLTGGIVNSWDLFEDKPLEQAIKALEQNYTLLILYEGKRTQSKKDPKYLKKGILRIANRTNSSIYAFQILPSLPLGYNVYFKGKLDSKERNDNFLQLLNDTVYD